MDNKQVMIDELQLVLTDPDTELSDGAHRVILWAIATLQAAGAAEPVAWALRRKRDGFIRGIYSTAPNSENRQIAEVDGDYYQPLYTAPQPAPSPAGEWIDPKCYAEDPVPAGDAGALAEEAMNAVLAVVDGFVLSEGRFKQLATLERKIKQLAALAQPVKQEPADDYGHTEHVCMAGVPMSDAAKRLGSMLVKALGPRHPAIDDFASLVLSASPAPTQPTAAQAALAAAVALIPKIECPMTPTEIAAEYASHDYSAELLLQHAILALAAQPQAASAPVAPAIWSSPCTFCAAMKKGA